MLVTFLPSADHSITILLPSGNRSAPYFFAVVLVSRVREVPLVLIIYIAISDCSMYPAWKRVSASLSTWGPLTNIIFLVLDTSCRTSMTLLWFLLPPTGHPASGVSVASLTFWSPPFWSPPTNSLDE